jgi:hypothetical protein
MVQLMNELRKCNIYNIYGVYSAINKNEIMSFLELEIITLSKVSQVQKDKGHMFSHMWKI